jgi:formylglycine-generating enzyme required for sulfatase activity
MDAAAGLARTVQVDALTWDRNGRDAVFLNHRDKRLAEAATLAGIDGYRKRLGAVEFDYLAACEAAERLARRRTRRLQALFGALVVAMIAGLAAWRYQEPLNEAVYWLGAGYALTVAKELALKPKDTFKECTDCPEMIVVPAGNFTMGSTEKDRQLDRWIGRADLDFARPQHRVTIAKPFAVSKFDVTFDEWDACATHGDCDPHIKDSRFGRGQRPVINNNWDDAQTYVAWLGRITGKPYRLLTDAEWEYAARAGTTTAYYWGDEIGKGNANCRGCDSQWEGEQTSPVGSFKPNAFGLYDMAGNVSQWVQDCYQNNYNGAPTDGPEWTGGDCLIRVVRGGSWVSIPQFLRSAFRISNAAGGRDNNLGFRVGRTLVTP